MLNKKQEKFLKENQLDQQINFEAYGTKIGVRSDCAAVIGEIKKRLPEILPMGWTEIKNGAPGYVFSIIFGGKSGEKASVFKNEELLAENISLGENWDFIKSQIRITVAEFSTEYVFLHAGVVGWKGKAIIIPGNSFAGKTTLVREFVKRGAEYFSDDLTVIDKNGFVHPFPKKLSIRGILENNQQVDFDVEELGGKRGDKPIPVGFLLLTEYRKSARLKLKLRSAGQGVMECIAHSLSVRQNPAFVLKVLNIITKDAIILKSFRSEAKDFVDNFLKFL